jgi:putative transcriptional regulator
LQKENERCRTFGEGWNNDGQSFYIEKAKAICKALECQPGDILEFRSDEDNQD